VKRRTLLLGALAAVAGARGAEPSSAPTVIAIVARKFVFTPDQITLRVGVPVILELTAPEVTMGFDAPGLKLNTEIPPGKPVRLAFTPDRPGEFEFVCDVFCGSGHEDMGGVIKVLA
jgi:cytochrome c oxidase subunit 2